MVDHQDNSLALCLAGGGSRGCNQAGNLAYIQRELLDTKVFKKCHIITSSVGTLNGTQFHAGDIDKMLHLWRTVRTKDIYSNYGVWDTALSLKRGYLHDSRPLRKLLDNYINPDKLYTADGDFWINATDLTCNGPYTREIKTLSPEEMVSMCLASASPPVYFPTVKIGERELCDSGVVNNFGITQAIDLGCKTIILLLPAKPSYSNGKGGIFQLLGKVMGLSMNTYLERESKAVNKVNSEINAYTLLVEKYNELAPDSLDIKDRPKKVKLITVSPKEDPSYDFLDFDFKGLDRNKILQAGYDRAKEVIERELW